MKTWNEDMRTESMARPDIHNAWRTCMWAIKDREARQKEWMSGWLLHPMDHIHLNEEKDTASVMPGIYSNGLGFDDVP